ncbi:hypothetical protein N7495_000484 [Penicillium taxi]|uniref:uncharacterized protein n=1 Tax=Penicillium taxi TaxID=168475 RepID=UPI00254516B3|nr:uncharacterized protein N7495_000484 [Penicillium taxi]KAJ5907802.1 hypothetical protein N7495_000484 [Penicillium taxi]
MDQINWAATIGDYINLDYLGLDNEANDVEIDLPATESSLIRDETAEKSEEELEEDSEEDLEVNTHLISG